MELSAVGERVFAAESIIKRRIRKVGVRCNVPFSPRALDITHRHLLIPPLPCKLMKYLLFVSDGMQGRIEYLVKWKGWSPK